MEQHDDMSKNDTQFFALGKNKIVITEHFQADGETISFILEKVILNAAKMAKKP